MDGRGKKRRQQGSFVGLFGQTCDQDGGGDVRLERSKARTPNDIEELLPGDKKPLVSAKLIVTQHDRLAIEWQRSSRRRCVAGAASLAETVRDLLAMDENVWDSREQWRQAVGIERLEVADWIRRTLLLCRVQVKAHALRGLSSADGGRFVALPDGVDGG
jgi:hypothetical protein